MAPTIKGKILVVDDSPIVTKIVQRVLTAKGYNVVAAKDGHEALQIFHEDNFALIILDVNMPGIDGFEVAKQLRLQPELKDVVLVAMTGYGEIVARQRSREAGFDHHLVKPADFGKLQEILASVSVVLDGNV